MERREAPGVCETPWELARPPWQTLCEGACPRVTAEPGGEPGPPTGTRDPSNVGASASRRSTAALLAKNLAHRPLPASREGRLMSAPPGEPGWAGI